jgi:hypothetical protein
MSASEPTAMVPLRGLRPYEAVNARRVGRGHGDELLQGDAPRAHPGGEQHGQADFQARHAIGDAVERRLLALELLALGIVEAVGRVVGGEYRERAVLDAAPDELLVRRIARRRGADVLGALEAGPVHVVRGQEQILRAGLAQHAQAARLGAADRIDRLAPGDVDDQDRHVEDFGQRDRPLGRLALGRGRVGDAVKLGRAMAGGEQALGQPGDHVVILGVDHDHGALAPRGREHGEHLGIVELEGVVGHINLERGVAVANQRRQFLAQHLLGRIGDDQMDRVVDHRLALGAGPVGLDHLAQRLALVLGGEGDQRGGAAAGRRDRAGAESIRGLDPLGAGLGDVAVGVDAAGQHQLAARVDGLVAARQRLAERHHPAVLHAEVAAASARGGDHAAAPDDEIEFGHIRYLVPLPGPLGVPSGTHGRTAQGPPQALPPPPGARSPCPRPDCG